MDAAAAATLKRAVEFDQKKRFTEALVCYQEGAQLLLEAMKSNSEERVKQHYRSKATEYIARAEELRKFIERAKERGEYQEQIKIEDGSVGHSYDAIFGRFLEKGVKKIQVADPYIRSHHQVQNFLRFCELSCKRCSDLKEIVLTTTPDPQKSHEQKGWLAQIGSSLQARGITLTVNLSQTLHDREVRLSTGWVIKVGRGLDYFKPFEHKFCLGYFDQDLRPCRETGVDISHEANIRTS